MLEILTGVLQGLTEFLPISSSGHLVIISSLSSELDLNTNDIAFLHIGTLFSTVFFYRKRIFEIFENLDTFKEQHPAFANLDPKKMLTDGISAPLHPGAIKYYKEAGLM